MKSRIHILLLVILIVSVMAGCGRQDADRGAVMDAKAASDRSEHAKISAVELTEGKYSEEKLDHTWEGTDSVQIELDGDEIAVKASEPGNGADGTDSDNKFGVNISKGRAVITQAGTYVLSGTLEDGQIVIDADKEDKEVKGAEEDADGSENTDLLAAKGSEKTRQRACKILG